MVDRPIIFSGPMVRALLTGRKTQTRRLVSSPLARCAVGDRLWVRESFRAEELCRPPVNLPATRRERQASGRTHMAVLDELDGADGIRYAADDQWARIEDTPRAAEDWMKAFHYGCVGGARPSGLVGKGVPSIHMSRWASRLTLIVTEVRRQPLQEITTHDATAEGIERADGNWRCYDDRQSHALTPRESFCSLWESLHDKPGERWSDNPEIVALTFTVTAENIDRMAAPSAADPQEAARG